MKKAISFLAVFVTLLMLAMSAFAAGNALTAEADQTALGRGDTVTVTVEFACEEAVSTVSALLEYDDEVFTVVEGKCNDQAGAVFTSYNEEHSGLALLFSEAQPREGLLGTFTLQVREAAKPGETAITLKPVFKAGAETLAADPIQLGFTVGCVHSWSEWSKAEGNEFQRTCFVCKEVEKVTHGEADHVWGSNGLCTACGAQKPPQPTEAPTAAPTTEPAEVPSTATEELEVTGEPSTEAAAGTSIPGSEIQKPAEGEQKAESNSEGLLWALLGLAVVAGGCAVILLLRKKRA